MNINDYGPELLFGTNLIYRVLGRPEFTEEERMQLMTCKSSTELSPKLQELLRLYKDEIAGIIIDGLKNFPSSKIKTKLNMEVYNDE